MKIVKRMLTLVLSFVMVLSLTACTDNQVQSSSSSLPENTPVTPTEQTATGQIPAEQTVTREIYLYGEQHANKTILDKEVEIWSDYYNNQNMRHLFVEQAYYTAEFLNLWMKQDNDDILNAIYEDWRGSAAYNPDVKAFFVEIKTKCPETVFHGTDVGHQYGTTGKRFLTYLEENVPDYENSEQYKRTLQAIEQGKYYYDHDDSAYRENKMTENFIAAYDAADSEKIMGIYGAAHTNQEGFINGTIPNMANQLAAYYKGTPAIFSADLTLMAKDKEPEREDVIALGGKEYKASYFGKEDLTGIQNFTSREFWRLEDAYADFKDSTKISDVLRYGNYPMQIEIGQIFVIDYTTTDGTVTRTYYRSDGEKWQGQDVTTAFAP